jgi:hypothetical protein
MSKMKELYTEIQSEMFNIAELLTTAAEDGDFELMNRTLIECTAKLAVATRRYSEAYL